MSYTQFRPASYNNANAPHAQTLYAPPPPATYTSQVPRRTVAMRDIPQSDSMTSNLSEGSVSNKLQAAQSATLKARNLNTNVEFSVQSKGDNKAIMLHNVEDPNCLNVTSETLSFVNQGVDANGDMKFTFMPDGDKHVVNVLNDGETIATFGLKPKKVPNDNVTCSVESSPDKSEKYILVKNVDNPDTISLMSSTIGFSKGTPDENGNSKYYFIPDGGEHVVSVYSDRRIATKFGIKPENVTVTLTKPDGDVHRMELNNLYNPGDLQVVSDRPLNWKLASGQNIGQGFIEFSAPQNSQVVQIFTVNKNGEKTLANNGNVVLAPIQAFKPIPPMSAFSTEKNAEEMSNQVRGQAYYTPVKSFSGEQGPPPAKVGSKTKAGNLVISGTSKSL